MNKNLKFQNKLIQCTTKQQMSFRIIIRNITIIITSYTKSTSQINRQTVNSYIYKKKEETKKILIKRKGFSNAFFTKTKQKLHFFNTTHTFHTQRKNNNTK